MLKKSKSTTNGIIEGDKVVLTGRVTKVFGSARHRRLVVRVSGALVDGRLQMDPAAVKKLPE